MFACEHLRIKNLLKSFSRINKHLFLLYKSHPLLFKSSSNSYLVNHLTLLLLVESFLDICILVNFSAVF